MDGVSGVSKTLLDCIFAFLVREMEIYLLWLVQVGELSGGGWGMRGMGLAVH